MEPAGFFLTQGVMMLVWAAFCTLRFYPVQASSLVL